VGVAALLAIMTLSGTITPWLLLALTFALSAGDAIETPTWRAVLPELVPKQDLPAASALNGIEFNLARATGPALAGALIAVAGVGAAFLVNVFSFIGVILVVASWKRAVKVRTAPIETLEGATVAALRYVRNAPVTRAVIFRTGVVMFCASAPLALLPTVAHAISRNAIAYGVLLGAFGAGAIAGAVVMQRARSRWSSETVVSFAIALLGVMTAAMPRFRTLAGLALVMFVSGGAWLTFISLANAFVQTVAPDWVRARVLAIFMLITQGGLAAGSVVWGIIGSRESVDAALVWAGLATVAATSLGFVARLPDRVVDLSPWNHWRMPAILESAAPGLEDGPVLVTLEYDVDPSQVNAFLKEMQRYGRVRRRSGASRWGIFRDVERPHVYLESFVVTSWAEHLRQHERVTKADTALEQEIRRRARGEPIVRHLIYAQPKE
jgi:predicted MFS family arabinose efflux permease